ncbi:MAG TPA: SMP-30/gluconolactonase/LRE family protein, partial [Planctomycetaceae bacterium]|nr:SMP-30/gluconolactonase/LRE family protein [Planctomycetaceae bacterium]
GEPGDAALLGVVTLEELGLMLNPFTRKLVHMRLLMACLLAMFGLFSTASAQDMPLSQVLIDGEGWQLLSEGHGFTEGPASDKEGNVFFTDIPNNRIHKIDLDGKVSLFAENTAKTNGLMFGPDGRLYGCRNGERTIVAYDSAGMPHTLAEDIDSNDLVVGSDGKMFVTDPPNQRVWLVTLSGEKKIVASGFRPNGVILWADEGTLVVTDSDKPHLWAFRVEKDGNLSCQERYYHPVVIPEGRDKPGSDGMTIDKDGRLYVATAAGLQMFDPTGRLSGVIHKPQNKSLSNVCFGGAGLAFLYVTNGDKVYRRKTKTAGVLYGTKK